LSIEIIEEKNRQKVIHSQFNHRSFIDHQLIHKYLKIRIDQKSTFIKISHNGC